MTNKIININQIPEVFKGSDTVFHYCPAETAIKLILLSKKLRLSPRGNSNDPIENLPPFVSFSEYGYPEDERASMGDAKIFAGKIISRIEYAKQICFCMNNTRINDRVTHTTLPYEYYGFLKPRMWDQYGDKYNGVCLAFSRKKLEEESKTDDLICDEVDYIRYSDLELNHLSVDTVKLKKDGYYEYLEEYEKRVDSILFSKHLDYGDENEYRIISTSSNDYDYLNIEKCLKGIIFSDYVDEFVQWALVKHGGDFNVETVKIKWDTTGINMYLLC